MGLGEQLSSCICCFWAGYPFTASGVYSRGAWLQTVRAAGHLRRHAKILLSDCRAGKSGGGRQRFAAGSAAVPGLQKGVEDGPHQLTKKESNRFCPCCPCPPGRKLSLNRLPRTLLTSKVAAGEEKAQRPFGGSEIVTVSPCEVQKKEENQYKEEECQSMDASGSM